MAEFKSQCICIKLCFKVGNYCRKLCYVKALFQGQKRMSTQYSIGFTTLKVDPSVSTSLSLLAFLHYCPLLVYLCFCLQFINFRTYLTYVFIHFTFNLISLHLTLYFLLLICSLFIRSIQKWHVTFPFCSVH